MQRLPLITAAVAIVAILTIAGIYPSESPHGKDLKINCNECHTTEGWKLDPNHSFNHSTTSFDLQGQHKTTGCLSCHPSLVFSDASSNCSDCHDDVHEKTVGSDCGRCHTPESWLVTNINEIHYMTRFPLVGGHAIADCYDCHTSEPMIIFTPLSIQCINCHMKNYTSTTNPNHTTSGFSTDCEDCHNMRAYEWNADGFHHNYFPLTKGHNISDCNRCHTPGNFSSASPVCFSCHESDYNSTTNPNHSAANFTTDCTLCHNTNPGWKPSTFDHDPDFPIYAGKHKGEWNSCSDCHTNTSNYAVFSCIDCHAHEKSKMDNEHDEENNYSYNSTACYNCHPRGIAD